MKKQVEYLQRLFYDIWNDFGSVYILVKYSDRTVIGKRGFSNEEKQRGLVLVFNNRTNNKLDWDEEGNMSCVLAFGARREDVFIHHDDIVSVFSPEASVQFVRTDMGQAPVHIDQEGDQDSTGAQVVSLNGFRQKKFGRHDT